MDCDITVVQGGADMDSNMTLRGSGYGTENPMDLAMRSVNGVDSSTFVIEVEYAVKAYTSPSEKRGMYCFNYVVYS